MNIKLYGNYSLLISEVATLILTLKGGTHVSWSPPFDFVDDVYLPILGRMGLSASCRLVAWGFYPVGGGRIAVEIQPTASLAPLELTERGELKCIRGRAIACNLPSHIAVRMVNRARNLLADLDVLVLDAVRYKPHPSHFSLEQAIEMVGVIFEPF